MNRKIQDIKEKLLEIYGETDKNEIFINFLQEYLKTNPIKLNCKTLKCNNIEQYDGYCIYCYIKQYPK